MPQYELLPDINVRSHTYSVARTEVRCWHCGLPTRVLALAVPHGHETLNEDISAGSGDRENAAADAWQRADASALLFYVECLNLDVERRLKRLSPLFRLAHSAAMSSSYWANHCEHCGTLLGDHELHCEPDVAFMPSSEAAAAAIELLDMQAPFEAAAAGYAPEPQFFHLVRKG
jgi:hypothetical protein